MPLGYQIIYLILDKIAKISTPKAYSQVFTSSSPLFRGQSTVVFMNEFPDDSSSFIITVARRLSTVNSTTTYSNSSEFIPLTVGPGSRANPRFVGVVFRKGCGHLPLGKSIFCPCVCPQHWVWSLETFGIRLRTQGLTLWYLLASPYSTHSWPKTTRFSGQCSETVLQEGPTRYLRRLQQHLARNMFETDMHNNFDFLDYSTSKRWSRVKTVFYVYRAKWLMFQDSKHLSGVGFPRQVSAGQKWHVRYTSQIGTQQWTLQSSWNSKYKKINSHNQAAVCRTKKNIPLFRCPSSVSVSLSLVPENLPFHIVDFIMMANGPFYMLQPRHRHSS